MERRIAEAVAAARAAPQTRVCIWADSWWEAKRLLDELGRVGVANHKGLAVRLENRSRIIVRVAP